MIIIVDVLFKCTNNIIFSRSIFLPLGTCGGRRFLLFFFYFFSLCCATINSINISW